MLTSHHVKYDHTVAWCLVQIHMCIVLFISSNELHFARAKVFTYVRTTEFSTKGYVVYSCLAPPLNPAVSHSATCSTNLYNVV